MSKTIKVIDLLNKIANGKIPKRIKHNNDIYKYSNHYNDYLHETKNHLYILFVENIIQDLNILDDTIEIIEEQEEIDIQQLIELENYKDTEYYDYRDIQTNRGMINLLVQAVKQLDKKIKEK